MYSLWIWQPTHTHTHTLLQCCSPTKAVGGARMLASLETFLSWTGWFGGGKRGQETMQKQQINVVLINMHGYILLWLGLLPEFHCEAVLWLQVCGSSKTHFYIRVNTTTWFQVFCVVIWLNILTDEYAKIKVVEPGCTLDDRSCRWGHKWPTFYHVDLLL